MMISISPTISHADETPPDMAFIEFLGEGIDVEQEYVDPVELEEFNRLLDGEQAVEEKQHDK